MSDVVPRGVPTDASRTLRDVLFRARARLDPHSRALIAMGGRALVVAMAVAVTTAAAHPVGPSGLPALALVCLIWLLCLRAAAAEAPVALGARVPAAVGTLTGLVCVMAVNPFLGALQLPLSTLIAMALGVFLSAAAWDTVLERLTRRRVLVIGDSAMEDIVAAASRDPRGRFEVVAAATYDADGMPAPSDAALSGLAAVVEAQHPDYIVLADEQSCSDAVERLLDMTDRRFRVAGLTSFFEHVFGFVPLGHMTPMWFLSLLHVRQRMRCRPVKRLLDVVVATVGLICAAPIMLVLALFIKRTPGPVLYHQTRLGEAGRRFRIHKLRSMGVAAERPGEPVYAQQDDPRVTGVGRFMRRTHLDELPQLWNVLRGEMSLVGPRPERPEFVEMLEGEVPYWSRRLLVRPGMTGWAQVRCGYATDGATSAEKLSYDFWYMRHSNLAVDLTVCVRTLVQMLEILDLRARRLRRGQTGNAAR